MSALQPPSHCDPRATRDTSRKVAAVVFADVVGYTRLMQVDEIDTHRRMVALQTAIIEPQVAAYRGTIIKYTGDGFLATFDSAEDATHCVVELQRMLTTEGQTESLSRRIVFRMAVHVADVIFDANDVFGDGVNVAARLQTYAEPGGIVVSEAVVKEIGRRNELDFSDLGHLPLRNIARPVRAYGIRSHASTLLPGDDLSGTEGRPSIVVLPFREHSAGAADAYFAEGIVDDIIHALAGLKELFVISRGSALGLSNAGFDVRAIGRELGVRYVMHGGVQRSETEIRIRTELCNAETGEIVHTDQYRGELKDLFQLQGKIANRVVTILAPQVRERERLRALRKHPQNMTAYDLVLQALGPLFGMNYESFSAAHGLLVRAINSDSHYGPAYSYASYWHILRVGQGWSTDPGNDTEQAARMASTAISLDENDALALAISGHVHSYLRHDFETAVELLERAIELGPSCATAWTLSSLTRGYLGHGSIAVAHAERGVHLSPRGTHVSFHEHILSQAHYIDGNYAEAAQWGRRAAKRNEGLTSNLRCLVASLVATGQTEEARQYAQRLLKFEPTMNLTDFARRTPLIGQIRDDFVERLRTAGIPD